MAGDRLTRILAVFSADILSLCFQAPSFAPMCVGSMARLLISPAPHSRCALWSLRRSKIPLDMAHFAQLDPPIPTQVAAIASAFPSASWGVGCVGGVPQRRCALLLLSRSRFLSCGPFVFLTYLIFPCFAPTDAPIASQGPLPLNADPSSMAARRASPLARKIYYLKLLDEVEQEPWLMHMGPCASCGQATGNYCDTCVTAGRSFEVPSGLIMSGTPLCSSCEDEFHCYVCVGVVLPGIAWPPTVPLVTLAAIPPAPTA